MRPIISWQWRISFLTLAILSAPLAAQPTKLPGVDDVKAVQAQYRTERDAIVKAGIAQRFIPAIMEKAEELAKKSDTAFAEGRLLQASEAIRQARWQLPYQPLGMPEHVSRIIGNLRLRHSRKINAVAFSPDGQKLATASDDGTVKIWDLGNGHELLTYAGHTDRVTCLIWSNDNKFIASAGQEKNIKLWDPTTGKEIKNIAATGAFVSSLALSNDGKHLFSGQHQTTPALINGLFVYETATGKLVREVRDFPNKLSTLALSHDGNLLAVGDDQGNLRLFQYPNFVANPNQGDFWKQADLLGATYHVAFSPDDKTLVRVGPLDIKLYTTPMPGAPFQAGAARLPITTNGTRTVAFSKDGKTLFAGNYDGHILLWDPETGNKLGEFKNAHNSPVNDLAFAPDGNRLASCSWDFTVRLWDFDLVLQSRDFEGHVGPVWTGNFSPDGTRVVSASADKTVKVWQRDTGKTLFTISDATAPVTIAQVSPDGKLIASGGGDKLVRIYDAVSGKPLRICEGHLGTITFLDFSVDSKRIVSCGADRRIIVWDAAKATKLLAITDNPSIVAGVAFSPDGKQIAVANIDQTIRLYDAANGKLQQSWYAHGVAVNGVAYSPNGQWLASCGADMAIMVWPLSTPGTNGMRLTGHGGPVSMVAFRKDNVHLISCGADQTVKLWKIEGNAGKEVRTFKGHKDWVTSVAFSRDGHHVVSSSVDRRLKIWEITNRELPLLAEHTNAVYAVAVSPDGKYIATGSADHTIKVWNRHTGVEIATLTGHTDLVLGLLFTADSKRIISTGVAGQKSEVRFWEVSPAREIARNPVQMNVFGKDKMRYTPYIAADPAGKTLFVWYPLNEASTSTMVEAYDIATGAPLYQFYETTRKINSLAFCANGKIAATGAKDGSVRLWELKQGTKADVSKDWFLFDRIGVADLALTPDGKILVATNEEGEIKIAKVQGHEVLKTFKGHTSKIRACMMSPDGKTFATVADDNVLKAWDLTGKELRRWDFGSHQGMFLLNFAFTPDGRQIVTANANTTIYVLDLP